MEVRLKELLAGKDVPSNIFASLAVIEVPFRTFAGEASQGELIVHAGLADEILFLFKKMNALGFPVGRMTPMHHYAWDDEASMDENNTSAFNYRVIMGTDRLSNHAFGRAIDINPYTNPYTAADYSIYPRGASYDPCLPGALHADGPIVQLFKEYGWEWGGDFPRPDWQHFQKP